jgi:hypothetical protein
LICGPGRGVAIFPAPPHSICGLSDS